MKKTNQHQVRLIGPQEQLRLALRSPTVYVTRLTKSCSALLRTYDVSVSGARTLSLRRHAYEAWKASVDEI